MRGPVRSLGGNNALCRESSEFRDSRAAHCFVTVDADRRGMSALRVIRPSVAYHLRPSENAFWADAHSIGCQKRRR